MRFSVQVPVAMLLTTEMEADSQELAISAAKELINSNFDEAFATSDDISATARDEVFGKDGGEEESSEMDVLRIGVSELA